MLTLEVLVASSEEYGMKVNKRKSEILIVNETCENSENITEIGGIPVTTEVKYLGVTILNKKDVFKEQKNLMIKKAHKLSNMTYSIISKSCNKIMIGKTYWKSIALPAILYGVNVMTLTETEIKQLQTIENGVYRKILGAPKYAPNCTLRGEIGSSLMKTRIMKGHLQYIRTTLQGRNELLKKVMEIELERKGSKWAKTTEK